MNVEGKVNILLVDDRPENLLALEAIIERDDLNLIKANSGEEALIHLLKYDFAVILLDVQMPGVDGFETAKIIKARERTKRIPIIFITANNLDSNHIFMGYSVGAIDYILKPFDPFILKAKVDIFVDMYRMNRKNVQQATRIMEKTKELEGLNNELSALTLELRESEAITSVISETSIDSMVVINKEGLVLKVNPAFEKQFQFQQAEIIGQSVFCLFLNEASRGFMTNILKAMNNLEDIMGNSSMNEIYSTRKDGTSFIGEIQIGKRYVKDKLLIACTIRDITKNKHDQELIKHMAFHDGLTNLPNRRQFNEYLNVKLNKAKETNTPLALFYLDMDRFKYVNDSLGHHIGDRILQEISSRLTKNIREGDLVARTGGDEFNIILPNTNRERAIEIAELIIGEFNNPFYIDQFEFIITTSIGISIFPYDGEDSLVLIKNADAALYRAKEQGKNRVKIFHSGMNIHFYRSFILQNDLRKAIERNELTLYYQPRVDLETGKIDSAEALIRWNHPNWGLIPPTEFISLAEETGQIIEIGEWVLTKACHQINDWKAKKLPPHRVAVNFSPKQFLKIDLIEKMKKTFEETEVNPKWIEIEITETTIMQNESKVISVLTEIKKMGITISIDDFGTGYSSLQYLRRLPVNTLKIDKSFIHDISIKHPESIAFISSILALGHSLKMSIIAEGVETKEQFTILKEQKCKEIQGYFFCPPVPPEDFEFFILDNLQNTSVISLEEETPTIFENLPIQIDSTEQVDQSVEIIKLALYRAKQLYSISSRETDVFQLILEGLSNREISDKLFISEHTVKNHITHILQKLNVSDRLQAMSIIYQTCIEESQNIRFQ